MDTRRTFWKHWKQKCWKLQQQTLELSVSHKSVPTQNTISAYDKVFLYLTMNGRFQLLNIHYATFITCNYSLLKPESWRKQLYSAAATSRTCYISRWNSFEQLNVLDSVTLCWKPYQLLIYSENLCKLSLISTSPIRTFLIVSFCTFSSFI